VNVESVCYQRTRAGLTESAGSWRINLLGEEGEEFCSSRCEEGDFVVNDDETTECNTSPSPLGKCIDNDPSNPDIQYIPDFCIQSRFPSGEFSTALYTTRRFGNETMCRLGDDGIYSEQFAVGDGSLCIPSSSIIGFQRILGSATRQCNRDGSLTITRYTDPKCSEQSENAYYPDEWVWTECAAPDFDLPEDVAEQANYRYTVDCETPIFYCKDFSTIEFFSTVSGNNGGSKDDGAFDRVLGWPFLVPLVAVVAVVTF
jgi:hypothetical protein